MEYGDLIQKAEANLKARNVLRSYVMEEGTSLREGAETSFVARFNSRYFERFGFKFRVIDSQEASMEITFFGRKFKTPLLSGALSGLTEATEKPLLKIAPASKKAVP
jgi:isopentenyl diphosphate isomerase/L-lactate dehydrogenase-like FMN-dependent dehydrogenase